MRLLIIIFHVTFLLLLSACSTHLKDYENTQPHFNLEKFFNGNLSAYGIIQNRSGKVIRRFSVDLHGHWQGDSGVLKEVFSFDNGELQHRTWQLQKLPDGSYKGSAGDVNGNAVGRSLGFAFHWRYSLNIKINDRDWAIDLDDWLYQLNSTRVINRTRMSKWGIEVGEITLLIEKVPNAP